MPIVGEGDLERYLRLVERGDRRGAVALVLELAEAGTSVEALVRDLLAPAQREVGHRWERREWNVAQEHAATAIADAALAVLGLDDDPPRRGDVVVACVEGEWHLLPARMTAEVFRELGWSVTFLGPSVPAHDLAAYATAARPDAVAVSCSVPALLPGARRCIDACRVAGVPVLAGGAGFGAGGRYATALGAAGWAADPVTGAAQLDRWLEAPPAVEAPRPPDGELLLLEAARPELVAGAAGRLTSGLGAQGDAGRVHDAVDLALAAVESARLVSDPELLLASAPVVVRALPDEAAGPGAFAEVLALLAPELRRYSRRAAALVEDVLPTAARRAPAS